MKTFFGGMFMNKENLRKEGILYPIKLEYYKIKDLKSKNDSVTHSVSDYWSLLSSCHSVMDTRMLRSGIYIDMHCHLTIR